MVVKEVVMDVDRVDAVQRVGVPVEPLPRMGRPQGEIAPKESMVEPAPFVPDKDVDKPALEAARANLFRLAMVAEEGKQRQLAPAPEKPQVRRSLLDLIGEAFSKLGIKWGESNKSGRVHQVFYPLKKEEGVMGEFRPDATEGVRHWQKAVIDDVELKIATTDPSIEATKTAQVLMAHMGDQGITPDAIQQRIPDEMKQLIAGASETENEAFFRHLGNVLNAVPAQGLKYAEQGGGSLGVGLGRLTDAMDNFIKSGLKGAKEAVLPEKKQRDLLEATLKRYIVPSLDGYRSVLEPRKGQFSTLFDNLNKIAAVQRGETVKKFPTTSGGEPKV